MCSSDLVISLSPKQLPKYCHYSPRGTTLRFLFLLTFYAKDFKRFLWFVHVIEIPKQSRRGNANTSKVPYFASFDRETIEWSNADLERSIAELETYLRELEQNSKGGKTNTCWRHFALLLCKEVLQYVRFQPMTTSGKFGTSLKRLSTNSCRSRGNGSSQN